MEQKNTFNIEVAEPLHKKTWENLTRFLRHGANKNEIDYAVALLRTFDKAWNFDSAEWEDSNKPQNPKEVNHYVIKVEGLPQIVPFAQVDPTKNRTEDARLSPVFVPLTDPEPIDGWNLIYDTIQEKNDCDDSTHPHPINWMEKSEEHSVLNMRFWFQPTYFPKDSKQLMPESWTGRFSYHVARALGNKSRSWENIRETCEVEFGLEQEKGKARIKDDFKAVFSQFEPSKEDEKTEVVYDSRNIYGIEKNKMKMTNSLKDTIITKNALERMTSERSSDPPPKLTELVIAQMFPNYSIDAKRIDLYKTLTELISVYKTGNLKGLEGFSKIQFSQYG